MDKKAWAAQLAVFKKTKARKPPATAKQNTEFNATCKYSHSGKNDPIVFGADRRLAHALVHGEQDHQGEHHGR